MPSPSIAAAFIGFVMALSGREARDEVGNSGQKLDSDPAEPEAGLVGSRLTYR